MNGQNLEAFLVVVNIEGCRDKPAVYGDPEILYLLIEPEYLQSKNWRSQIKFGLIKKFTFIFSFDICPRNLKFKRLSMNFPSVSIKRAYQDTERKSVIFIGYEKTLIIY